jgi:hypothetical protein
MSQSEHAILAFEFVNVPIGHGMGETSPGASAYIPNGAIIHVDDELAPIDDE